MPKQKLQKQKDSPRKLQTLRGFRDFLPVKTTKKTRAGIFIDDANFFYAQKIAGWKIDWEKFIDLIKNNVNLKIARYYMEMPSSGNSRIKNIKHQKRLEGFGYAVVTKLLKKIYINKSKGKFIHKCNFDVEIALDIATFLPQLDLVIILSGDSDFIAVRNIVLSNQKQIIFMCFEKNMPWEIRISKFILVDKMRKFVELN